MATNDFNMTRLDLVKASLRRLGNHRPDSISIANAVQGLNILIREKDESARWFWAISNTESTLTLVSGQRSYAVATPVTATTIPNNIVQLENVQIYTTGTYDPPMRVLSKDEALKTWFRETSTNGRPYVVYLEKGVTPAANNLHFFPTTDAAYTIKYNYRRSLAEFDASSDHPDVPQHAFKTLISLLSHYLAPEYGVDPNTYQILSTEAEKAWQQLLANNAEQYDAIPVRTEFF